jgi:hypothetical protein
MRILFCREYFYPELTWDQLASLLPGHDIASCSRETIAEHLAGVDIIVPFGAPILQDIIERGTFGLIHEFLMRARALAENVECYAQGQPLLYAINKPTHLRKI